MLSTTSIVIDGLRPECVLFQTQDSNEYLACTHIYVSV